MIKKSEATLNEKMINGVIIKEETTTFNSCGCGFGFPERPKPSGRQSVCL